MNRIVLFLFSILLGQTLSANAQNLRAEFAVARFHSPVDGPYLEAYVKLKGNTLKLMPVQGGFQSSAIVGLEILRGNETVYQDRVVVNGPLLETDSIRQDFIDVQRIPLEKGKYKLKLTLADVNDSISDEVTVNQEIELVHTEGNWISSDGGETKFDPTKGGVEVPTGGSEYNNINYFISDIQPIGEYKKSTSKSILTKNGIDLTPYTSNFYPETQNRISFYTEIYNTNKANASKTSLADKQFKTDSGKPFKYLVKAFIESADGGQVVNELGTYFKKDSAQVIPILHSFQIDELETGNYNLVIELRNSENKLLESKSFYFQRFNNIPTEYTMPEELSDEDELNLTFVGKYNSPEELEEYLRCLHPISAQQEISFVNQGLRKKTLNVVLMKKFLYNFWKQRNPNDPEGAWLKYWAEVEKVNAAYSTNHKKGYDTDRGRVYLQYGAPNTISPSYFEPNTYPYEIWHYYVLKDGKLNAEQNNRKFVFANIEGGTSEFDLIHSDAKNEITNQRWHHDLHSRSSQSINLDVQDAGDHYGGRSKDFFENPY